MLNIYLLSQDIIGGYDYYDSMVVIAKTEEEARRITPTKSKRLRGWTEPEYVQVTLLGKADPAYKESTLVITSFNAG